MNAIETINDLVTNRGALLEVYPGRSALPGATGPALTLLAAVVLPDATHLNYTVVPPAPVPQVTDSESGPRHPMSAASDLPVLSFTFASLRRLHALAVGFYDEQGELIARVAQIRECELDAPQELQFTAQFKAWKSAGVNPPAQA